MLILDNREGKLIDLIKTVSPSIQYSTENLAVGDIIIRYLAKEELPTYEIIIERKCVSDMVASIKDGRYKEQKLRLLAQQKQNVKIVYLIEGTPADLRLPQDKVMLTGSIISSIFRDGIPVIRTYSLQETWDMISRLHDRLIKDYNDFFPTINQRIPSSLNTTNTANTDTNTAKITNSNIDISNPEVHTTATATATATTITTTTTNATVNTNMIDNLYLASIKKNKKENMTPQIWNMNCLCGIPGVSNSIALKIAEQYPTVRKLLDTYNTITIQSEKENLLSQIILCETDKQKRRIGNVISKRIYDYFHC